MFPGFAVNNHADNRWGNAIFGGKFSAVPSLVSSANVANVLRCKLGIMLLLAAHRALASLCHHIVNVVLMGTEEQMGWIDAAGIVASVADKHSIRDGAVGKFIRYAMRWCGGNAAASWSYCAVSILVAVREPLPAVIGAALVDLAPEAFGKRATRKGFALDAMPNDESPLAARELWFREGSATTALAEFYRGIARGMIAHGNSLLSAVAHATERFQSLRWQLYWVLPVHYTTSGGL